MRQPLRGIGLVISWCTAVLISGCVALFSPLTSGLEMEAAGQYSAAAEVYLGLLEDDPNLEPARDRLREIGPLAMEDLMRRAVEAREEGDNVAAMRHVLEVEQLRRKAGSAGVVLSLPEELTSFREETAREAVDRLVRRAEEAAEDGAWSKAEASYGQALRYASEERHAELRAVMLELQLRRAEAELSEARFAEAYDRVQHVLKQLEENDPRREEAVRLSRAALDAAAHHVALMPVGVSDELAGQFPEELRVELQEAFEQHFWQGTPRFIRSVSRDARRRELRRLPHDRSRLQHRHAVEFGRVLRADLVVLTEVVGFRLRELEVQRGQRSDRARSGTSTDSETVEGVEDVILEIEAEVAYRMIAPSFGLILSQGTVRSSTQQRVGRTALAEAAQNMALTGEGRERFEVGAITGQGHHAVQDLINAIVDELSQRLYRDALPGHVRLPDLSGN